MIGNSIDRSMALRSSAFATMLIAAAVFEGGVEPAAAQEGRPNRRAEDSSGDEVPQRLRRSGLGVRAAVRRPSRAARRATVEVRGDDRRLGLGAVVDGDGWIVTKSSLLKGRLTCRLADGRSLAAEVRAEDRATDLALLKVEARGLHAVTWPTGQTPDVGRFVVTTGLAAEPLAVGVVSEPVRPVPRRRALLGVLLDDVVELARVRRVLPESGAAQAGLKPQDQITHVDGDRIEDRKALLLRLRRYTPGEQVELTIRREEQELKAKAVLTAEIGQGGPGRGHEAEISGPLSTRRHGFPQAVAHDTALRPSDCGGPLVDLEGRLVGLNIARADRTASYALPAELVQAVVGRLRSEAAPASRE